MSDRTVNNSLVNELTPADDGDNACLRCQCAACTYQGCPCPCSGPHMSCMAPVVNCDLARD